MPQFVKKGLMLPIWAIAAIVCGAGYALWRLVPKCSCSDDSDNWSFPRTGVVKQFGTAPVMYRVCLKHGVERMYDYQQMRFFTDREVKEYLEGQKERDNGRMAVSCSASV